MKIDLAHDVYPAPERGQSKKKEIETVIEKAMDGRK